MYHKRLRKIVVLYIVVRLSDRGDMESFDFEGFNIQGLNIDGHRYLDGFYVLSVAQEIDASQMAKRTEQTALFNVIEFDAYGQN
ncbi:MAG: hypothetical protein ACE5IY_22525, partial [bacterium]